MARFRKQQIHFFLTDRCNLKCDYCYREDEPGKKGDVLDIEFAKLGIDDFFAANASRGIRFFADGEPTMEFGLMKEIHAYAKSIAGDKLKVELQTNGMFTSAVSDWIAENVDVCWISHDGPHAHDINRKTIGGKPSSPVVESNIKRLAESTVYLGVRSTISFENVSRQEELVRFFAGMKVKAIAADPYFPPIGECTDCSDKRCNNHKNIFYFEFARQYLNAAEIASGIGVFYTTIAAVNFDEKTKAACQACIPCPHLTPDGYVSACDMATRGDTPLQALIYGKFNKEEKRIEYFPDKIALLRSRSLENLEHCVECAVKEHCAGSCLGETLNETGSLFGKREETCNLTRFLYNHLPTQKGIYPCHHP